jgi:hypothetical protein
MKDSQNELEREKEKNRELYKKSIQLESQLASTNGIEVIIRVILILNCSYSFVARINGYQFEIKK